MADFDFLWEGEWDGHYLVKTVHHFPDRDDVDDHFFQGREGLVFRVETDDRGNRLMDNGLPAPLRQEDDSEEEVEYLPRGRQWRRSNRLRVDDKAILDAIQSIHNQRLVDGYRNRGRPTPHLHWKPQDEAGVGRLVADLRGLQGRRAQ